MSRNLVSRRQTASPFDPADSEASTSRLILVLLGLRTCRVADVTA